MTIYRMTSDTLEPVGETTFARAGVSERNDLQRLLKSQIDIIAPGTLVIAEEFSDWEDSRRRIDLLGVDPDGTIVVIELKRTEDGGHMELQAIRYAAMVSTLDFERVVRIFEAYLSKNDDDRDARSVLLDHIGQDEPDEDAFAQDVRIVLASAEFSREITTTALWLNDRGLDIRCVRIKPYDNKDDLLLDVQQIIPLPDAQEYINQFKEKQQKAREARAASRSRSHYDVQVGGVESSGLNKRNAIYALVRGVFDAGVSPDSISQTLAWRSGLFRVVDGEVDATTFASLAVQNGRAFSPRRWFCNDDELLKSAGKTYALTNQWGPRGERAMQELVDGFPSADVSWKRSN